MTNKTLIQGLDAIRNSLNATGETPQQSFYVTFTSKIHAPSDTTIIIDASKEENDGVTETPASIITAEQKAAQKKLDAAIKVFQNVLGESNVELTRKSKLPDPEMPSIGNTVTSSASIEFLQHQMALQEHEAQRDKQKQAGYERVLRLHTQHGLSLRDMFAAKKVEIEGLVKDIIEACEQATDRFIPLDQRKPRTDIVAYAAMDKQSLSLEINMGDPALVSAFADSARRVFFAEYSKGEISDVGRTSDPKKLKLTFGDHVQQIPKHTIRAYMDDAIAALSTWTEREDGSFISGKFKDQFQPAQLTFILPALEHKRRLPALDYNTKDNRLVIKPLGFDFEKPDDLQQELWKCNKFIQEEIGGTIQRGRSPS